MRRKHKHKRLLSYLSNLVILIVQTGIFVYLWYQCYEPMLEEDFWRRGNWAVIGMFVFITFFFTKTLGGYKAGYLRITDICLSQTLAIFLSTVVQYLQICMVGKDYFPVKPIILAAIVQLMFIVPWVYFIRHVFVRLYPPRTVLVIYGERSPKELIKKINTRKDRYNICGQESYLAEKEILEEKIKEHDAVILCDLPAHERNLIMKHCFEQNKRIYMTPKLSDILIRGSEHIHLFDTPLYLARNQGLHPEQRFVKRALDIVLSIIATVISLPFVLVLALLIKMEDKGPVFYSQERLTEGNRKFMILKFRSMRVNSEKEGARLAAKGDNRITKVGKFIRATHLDELPQIYNILKGDMSFVGPRPEREEIAKEYQKEIPEFGFRLKVKAGLTGYAQVYGKYNTTPYDKLKLDLIYIQTYSVWMDIKLMLMTFKIMFQKENTEGVEKEQRTAKR
ncbi:MAG: sugar transferase [Lachnospiraceae bacterium]|nr:sugar transferase [Lachnospiraceae bacterium]